MVNTQPVVIKDARLIFKNFAGKPDRYHKDGGIRSFCIILDPVIAERLSSDGWNVRYLRPREELEDPTPYIQVSVSFKNRPPRIVSITQGGKRKTPVTEQTVEMLDYAEMQKVDLTIVPYFWEMNGSSGIKAYLRSMFVTLVEDELDELYADEEPYEPEFDDVF